MRKEHIHRPDMSGPPTLTEQAQGLARALIQTSAAWISGLPATVSDTEYDRRLGICRSCSAWKEDGNLGFGKCMRCGCTRLKQRLASEICPLGKWTTLDKSRSEN